MIADEIPLKTTQLRSKKPIQHKPRPRKKSLYTKVIYGEKVKKPIATLTPPSKLKVSHIFHEKAHLT